MLKLGAVPFCQTNVPQALFTMQTSNPLYGATGNPLDKDRECGGSTGGEGSIVGAGKLQLLSGISFHTGNETVRWDLHTQIITVFRVTIGCSDSFLIPKKDLLNLRIL